MNGQGKVSPRSMEHGEIVIDSSADGSSVIPTIVKPPQSGLSVLGYGDVKSTPINPKIRQELDYLDREVRVSPLRADRDVSLTRNCCMSLPINPIYFGNETRVSKISRVTPMVY